MNILEQLTRSTDLDQATISHIHDCYKTLPGLKSFEVTAFGPSGPDQQNVSERRVITDGKRLQHASSNANQGKWLTRLAAYAAKNSDKKIQVIELGTCVGISAMYLLAGLSEGKGGHVTSFEGSSELAQLSAKHIDKFIIDNKLDNVSYEIVVGSLDSTLPAWINALETKLDLAFIDGNHQEKPTIAYHHLIKGHMHDSAIMVHDDIAWGEGMQRAWNTIVELELDSKIVEFYLGGKASRGLIFLGEPSELPFEVIHTDSILGRTARKIKAAMKA